MGSSGSQCPPSAKKERKGPIIKPKSYQVQLQLKNSQIQYMDELPTLIAVSPTGRHSEFEPSRPTSQKRLEKMPPVRKLSLIKKVSGKDILNEG